jgi:hypothetical protein
MDARPRAALAGLSRLSVIERDHVLRVRQVSVARKPH